MAQLTQTTRQHLAALAPVQPTGLKMGQAQAAKYDFHRLLHHLETDIVMEYLLEAEQ